MIKRRHRYISGRAPRNGQHLKGPLRALSLFGNAGRRLIFSSLVCASVIAWAPLKPAAAENDPLQDGEFNNLVSIRREMENRRTKVSELEERLAGLGSRIKSASEEVRPIYEVLNPPLRDGGPIRERETLQGRIQALWIYNFRNALPDIAASRIAQFEGLLPPLIRRAELNKDMNRGRQSDSQLQARIDALQKVVNYWQSIKLLAEEDLPSLLVPDFVPAGTAPDRHLANLLKDRNTLSARILALETDLSKAIGRLSGLNKTFEKIEQEANTHRNRYYHLLAKANLEFAPPYIKDAKVFALDDPREGDNLYAHLTVEDHPGFQALDEEIEALVLLLPDANQAVAAASTNLGKVRSNFEEETRKWLELNNKYRYIEYGEYALNFALEAGDIIISLASSGFEPVGFLFDAGYRMNEWRTKNFTIKHSVLGEDLANWRASVAAKLRHPDLVTNETDSKAILEALKIKSAQHIDASGLYATYSDRMADHLSGDQIGEVKKGVWSFAFSQVWDRIAKQMVINELKKMQESPAGREMLAGIFTMAVMSNEIATGQLRRHLYEDGHLLYKKMLDVMNGSLGDVTGKQLATLKGKTKFDAVTGIAKDFLVGAMVTYGKDVLKTPYQEWRVEVATELALAEICWMVRQYDYQMAAKVHRDHQKGLKELQGHIGSLIEKRSTLKRDVKYDVKGSFSTFDRLAIVLEFSAPPAAPATTLGSESVPLTNNDDNQYRFETTKIPTPAGSTSLSVRTEKASNESGLGLDTDPRTPAIFMADSSGRVYWQGFEEQDGTADIFELIFEAPELSFDGENTADVRPKESMEVSYTLTGSLPYREVFLTVVPEAEPGDKMLDNGAQGVIDMIAPNKPGSFEIRLLEKGSSVSFASLPFRVVAPPVTIRVKLDGGSTSAQMKVKHAEQEQD